LIIVLTGSAIKIPTSFPLHSLKNVDNDKYETHIRRKQNEST
jgi:hypothetical protein